jgi:1-phosphatidylinositol-3-phosphate 5-kinase
MSNAHTASPLPSPTLSQTSSIFSAAKPYKIFTSGASPQPDPDQDDTWRTPEPFSAVISRKQHPRDPSSLLSLRDVLRHRTHVEGSNGQQPSILSNTASRITDTKSILSGQSVVEVNNQVDEEVAASPEGVDLGGKNPEPVGEGLTESNTANALAPSAGTVDTHVHHEKSTSVLSAKSEATVVPDDSTHVTRPPTPPPKDDHKKGVPGNQAPSVQAGARTSSFTTSLTSGFTNAVRYVLRDNPVPSGPPPNPNHQSVLSVDSTIDDQPHIKYDWTIGKRLKFSCTVYYAKQFDVLRRRCGLDDVFITSLGQCANWAAEGGKSKSNFWKTCDNRFIIKTLVNAWNVADL